MKNESGVSEDITMLEALKRLWHHKAKRMTISFEVTFDDVSRKVIFGKIWSSVSNDWNYYVQDGDYTPQYVYGERQIVSTIMSISGMSLFGYSVRYHIHQNNQYIVWRRSPSNWATPPFICTFLRSDIFDMEYF